MSKKMKIINIILLFGMICCSFLGFYTVKAEDFYEVNFTVLNTEEACKVYWLLPEKYINYINQQTGVNFKIDDIKGNTKAQSSYISYFNVSNVQNEIYEENGVRYLQVELKEVAHSFLFYIAPGYTDMDYKLRYKSDTRDVILHLNKFTYNEDGDCNIKYDYLLNDFKTEDEAKKGVSKYVAMLITLLAIMCIANILDNRGRVTKGKRN